MHQRLLRFVPPAIALALSLSCGLPALGPAKRPTVKPTVAPTIAVAKPTARPTVKPTASVVPTKAAVQAGAGEQLRQWASTASASSEFGDPGWSANQATGAPDTLECGDTQTAWASASRDTQEWLELSFASPVVPTQINIVESYSPSQVVKVELVDTTSGYHEVYRGLPEQLALDACPYTLTINVKGADYEAAGVRISIDQSGIGQWNEIDAVELVGTVPGG